MFRRIVIAIVIGAVLGISSLIGTPVSAEAKVVTKHGVAIDIKKNAMAVKCKKRGQAFRTVKVYYICPRRGWYAYMRVGESFSPEDVAYWKFYRTKKKALRASSRSAQNKYLPTCVKEDANGECTEWKRYY